MGSPTTDFQILTFKISELQTGVCHHFHKFPNWQQRLKNYYIYPMEKRTISLNITLLINIML